MDKSKHLGNRYEEERRTNPPIQGIQTGTAASIGAPTKGAITPIMLLID